MAIVNGYAAVADLREHFGDTGTVLDEQLLERDIESASRQIDEYCGRRFWLDPTVTVRVYRPDDAYEADVADIGSTTGLIIKTDTGEDGTYATTWASTDYQLEPLNATTGPDSAAYAWWRLVAIDRYLFLAGRRRHSLQVTARHGWSAVPKPVVKACILRTASLYKRREAVFGAAAMNGFGEMRIGRRDFDVTDLLHPYVRMGVGAV